MIVNIFKHLRLVVRHKNKVLIHCIKCGIPIRGLLHDLSKFTPTEFFESARYYRGIGSPISLCSKVNGVSYAWLHHKGRNKHHIEYWQDDDCEQHPLMPYKYAVECVCDKLSATKIYKGKEYSEDLPLLHWQRWGSTVRGNEKTKLFVETVFTDLREHGEAYILNKKYMKDTYSRVCLSTTAEDSEQGSQSPNNA